MYRMAEMLFQASICVGIWQAIPRLVVLRNRSIIGSSTLLYLSHPFAYELTRSNVFYFALPLAVLPAYCHCLVYFNNMGIVDYSYLHIDVKK